jgi:hypothetical protein
MHQIMLNVMHSVRYKLQRKIGYFGIYGYDFMIDENMKTWLIEINVNPAITCNTDVLNAAIPPAIIEGLRKISFCLVFYFLFLSYHFSLENIENMFYCFILKDIAIECFDKSKNNKKLLPLNTLKTYSVIYYEPPFSQIRPGLDRSPTMLRKSLNNSPPNNNNHTNNNHTNNNQPQKPVQNVGLSTSPNSLQSQKQIIDSTLKPPRNEINFVQRNSLAVNSTIMNNRRSLIQVESNQQNNNNNIGGIDLSKSNDFAKLRLGYRGRNHPSSLTSLELKPSTVEGYLILYLFFLLTKIFVIHTECVILSQLIDLLEIIFFNFRSWL